MKKIPLSRDSRRRIKHANAYYVEGRIGAYSYDHIYGAAASAAADFFIDRATRFGGPVLELGAGTGLISWPVAAAGFDVVAVDLSAKMLALAERKQEHYPQDVVDRLRFIRADMVDFEIEQRFRTVMLPGRSFQHLLTPEDQRAALRRIHTHLEPGGGLVLTLFDPDLRYCVPGAPPPIEQEQFEDPASGRRIRRTFLDRQTDPRRQVFSETIRLELLESGGKILASQETRWSLRWSYQQEMRYLIEASGFEIDALFSDFSGAPADYGEEQIWIAHRGKSLPTR